jgi:hypothetical protein
MSSSPSTNTPLLHRIDVLHFPTGDTERDIDKSKSRLGAVLTLLIPVALAVYFAIQYVQNQNAPNVSTTTSVDLNSIAPLQVTLRCTIPVTPGQDLDPVCPSADFPNAVYGFQFVNHLIGTAAGGSARSSCSAQARGSVGRTDSSRSWPLQNPRSLLDEYIQLGNLSTFLTPAQQAALPYVSTTYGKLVRSFGIATSDLWPGAGLALGSGVSSSNSNSSNDVGAWASALQSSPKTSGGVDALAAGVSDLSASVGQELGPDTAPRPVSSEATASAIFGPFPACPYSRISTSKTLTASQPAAGVGYIAPLLPGFNWSSAAQVPRYLTVDASAAFGIQTPMRVPITPPAASATGDELHDLWVGAEGKECVPTITR